MRTFRFYYALLTMLMLSFAVLAQQKITVKGVVVDPDNEPLTGASVVVKGTTIGVAADINGNFTLKDVPANGVLLVTYIGFTQKEVPVKAGEMKIILQEDVKMLQEVMVIGYGTIKKEDATGSVVAIKAEELNKGVVTSPQQLMQGKIAGVQVSPGDGGPGSSSTIRIRGQASLNASNDPLIVIDGVPVAGNSAPGMANPLSTINPATIETFTVLKDASATAIYGSRASNGVILITTKKGGGARPSISYNSTYSVNVNPKSVSVLSSSDYQKFIEANYDAATQAMLGVTDSEGNNVRYNTDWQKEIFRPSFSTDQNVSLQGTVNKFMPYRATFGYTNENGTLKTSEFERFTGDISLSPKFFEDHLSVNVNAKGVSNYNRYANSGAVNSAIFFDPTKPIHMDYANDRYNGYYTWESNNLPSSQAYTNPLAMLEQVKNTSRVNRFIGNVQFDYKMHFLPDLRVNLNLGYDHTASSSHNGPVVNSPQAWGDDLFPGEGRYTKGRDYRTNRLLEFYTAYAKQLGKHRFDLMAGYSWQHFKESGRTRVLSNTSQSLYSDVPYAAENYLVSFFGRANYVFDDRYLVTFTLRDDGSSRFAKNNRWGLFPSGALGWNMYNEEFIKDIEFISNLKIRAGVGATGQQDLGTDYYPYLSRYNLSKEDVTYMFGGQSYRLLKPLAYDKDIKWETTITYNAGLDFGFLGDRITGSLDYYYRKTKDLLNYAPVPMGSNFSNSVLTNLGDMVNRGFEVVLNGEAIRTRDFSWNIGFNGTFQKTKIDKLTAFGASTGIQVGGISGGSGNTIQLNQAGYSPYMFYAFQQVYDEKGKPIQNVFVDQNGDGVITDADRYCTNKKPAPDFFFGITSSFKYKKWDAGFNLRGSIGNYMFNDFAAANSSSNVIYRGSLTNLPHVMFKQGFTDLNNVNQFRSDLFLEDASFLRLDNITVGYTFDKIANTNMKIRVYGAAQNVFTITKYSGLDPEGSGIDNNIWPRSFIATLGLNMNF